ncbi:MAG: hypothetical protein PHP26_04395 [Syntrophomonas sp.]|uniref:hypothetical protein n=1 Tax=Syntrophomonas sp. TaxID=2053627 RepID=UPI00260833E2|nr:hypothetical protein [Syntrophomonas sp.]MDD2510951.1 hypothetical protein [Syntrophomonas sp.]MDD3879215.1 hypothetical protein [Syntrophomonas sp.]MDD4626995.1 hypothetical protein [Syntrophomonas sp.]
MNDTSSTVENKLFEMMQQKTESERFFMAASMFDMARLVSKAAILEDKPDISPDEARVELFRYWYWEDFDTDDRENILQAIRSY